TATEGDTDSATDTDTDTDGDTDTGGGLWCVDADMDGFGDPDNCRMSDGPVDGSVPNGDDCDDTNPETYPGAAEIEDPTGLFCMQDEDDDGWGDDTPPPGVDPGTDCADDNPNAFPGAAVEELPPDLCAEDEDGDGWGDIDPPPGVDPGTDCDDTNPDAFPGAAPNETPMDLCTVDSDGDGWGDANPGGGGGGGPGPSSGSDCYPTNADLNPDTVQLTALLPFFLPGAVTPVPRTIQTVDPTDASLGPFVTLQGPMGGALDQLVVIAVALSELGDILANDRTNRQLYSIDYLTGGACMMAQGTAAPVGMSYDANPMTTLAPEDIVCAIEYGPGGGLYGVDYASQLLEFDPATGQITNATPLTGTTINGCGMARDCTEDRLLIANRQNQSILSIDVATGMVTPVRDLQAELVALGIPWDGPTGLEYDPVTRHAFLSVGAFLLDVDLAPVAPAPTVVIGAYGQLVSNLQYLPICN
ncbi:MAG: hypothetical protein AB1Z98_16475, partial [Nannocystaceae bacterium]